MTLPRSPRPNYTETLPSFFLRLSFVLHGPYYYKAVALIPPRPCAIHSPLVRLLAGLLSPSTGLFLLFTFCLVTCTAFLHRLADFDAEIETAGPRPLLHLYCATLCFELAGSRSKPLHFPFSCLSSIVRHAHFYEPARSPCSFFSVKPRPCTPRFSSRKDDGRRKDIKMTRWWSLDITSERITYFKSIQKLIKRYSKTFRRLPMIN